MHLTQHIGKKNFLQIQLNDAVNSGYYMDNIDGSHEMPIDLMQTMDLPHIFKIACAQMWRIKNGPNAAVGALKIIVDGVVVVVVAADLTADATNQLKYSLLSNI